VQVQIEKNVLEWVLRQSQNMEISEKNLTLLTKWLAEEKTPTFNQVETVSRATGIPFGYFFLKEPPVEDTSLMEYRTLDSIEMETPSRNLMATIHDMELIQDWIREDLRDKGMDPLPFVGAMDTESGVEELANYIRGILGLDLAWFLRCRSSHDSFRYLREAISGVGVTVMLSGIVGNNTRRVLSLGEFRGFALVDELAPLIFINNCDSFNGKLFSLLHEFGHIVLGQNSLYNDRFSFGRGVSKTEVLCNAVTAEILVPHELFLREWEEAAAAEITERIDTVAKAFRCGSVVIARRALDAGLVKKNIYADIVQLAAKKYQEQQREKSSGGDYYRTVNSRIDRRFLDSLVSSVNAGRTLYTEAYRLTHTSKATFDRLILQSKG